MKETLKNLTLARWIMIFSLLAAIGLGVYGYKLHAKRTDLEFIIDSKVRALAVELQTLAKQHSALVKQFDREGLLEQKDPSSYIRNIAASPNVQIGDIAVDPPNETENIKGILDTRIGIKPASRDRGYPRLNIANFLYKLESESRRMRVTRLRLEPEAKSVRPENILDNDMWRWEAEVTSRTKMDTPPPPATKKP
ncbi:MAG TPA: hypothetical protein VK843_18960 [Planctomycetota bacterium]|nr:hypothetical protein [Planctomycetota bacterium]